MKGKADSGLSEVVSFMLILALIIVALALVALIILPIMGANDEQVHNGDVLREFANMKADVDTAWLSDNTGVTRQAVFTLSPAGDKTKITVFPNLFGVLSFGMVSLEYGPQISGDYYTVNIMYRSSNMYSEDIEIVYSGGALSENNKIILAGSNAGTNNYIVVVNKSEVAEKSIGGNGIVTLEYRLDKIIYDYPNYLCVFSMGLR
jgi:hypothetical protein